MIRLLSISRLARGSRVEPWEAARIADSLIPMGMPASQAVCAWVEEEMRRPDCSEETVALAVRILGSIGDPEAEPTLLELLKSPNPEWRVTAASALERTGGPNAIEPLLEAIDDHAWQVRARAAISLGAIGGPGVARALAGLLYDPVWWVRQNAASALAMIGPFPPIFTCWVTGSMFVLRPAASATRPANCEIVSIRS